MTLEQKLLLARTRRHFFKDCGVGVGKMALASLLANHLPGASKGMHHPAKIDHVIYLFMAGAPSQLELFDYKPELVKYDQKPTPDSFLNGKRFAFMDTFTKERPKLLGTRRKFQQHGQSGLHFSDLLPHVGGVADDLAVIHGLST